MVLNLSKANKQQLITLALYENISMGLKYEVCRELQIRWNSNMLADLIRLYGKGMEVWEIADYLGIGEETARENIWRYKLRRVKAM